MTEDGSFKLNENCRVTITLEDVLFLTGLPIDGKPVTGIDEKPRRDINIIRSQSSVLQKARP